MKINLKKLILVVDDSVDNQTLLDMLFVAKGYAVKCASNGQEALGLLKKLLILPDLILLDAQMPLMDGFEFRKEQSKNERLKNIPVIVMTGDADVSVRKKMNYPLALLLKPLQIESVTQSISNFLN